MKIYIEPFEFSRDEYDSPFWINTDHPEGKVSIGTLRYGCEEAKESVSDLEAFGNELAGSFDRISELEAERDELRARLEAVRGWIDSAEVGVTGWDHSEDIMTLNGRPIGSTLPRGIDAHRWWPDLKHAIRGHLDSILSDTTGKEESDA